MTLHVGESCNLKYNQQHKIKLDTLALVNLAFSVPADVEFNVSGMFAMPIPASNHNNHLDYDSGTIERKRPGSMVGPENDTTRKDK